MRANSVYAWRGRWIPASAPPNVAGPTATAMGLPPPPRINAIHTHKRVERAFMRANSVYACGDTPHDPIDSGRGTP
jgi:hypothetical protein